MSAKALRDFADRPLLVRGSACRRDVATSYHDGVLGRMRSRAVGQPLSGVPEVVLVQGMAVADYLLPGLAAFGEWTRAHLVELPGFGGSGEPPHELSVPEFGRAVADWLTAQRLGPVVLAATSPRHYGTDRSGAPRRGGVPRQLQFLARLHHQHRYGRARHVDRAVVVEVDECGNRHA